MCSMGQYDEIIDSYLEKQATLRGQLRLLEQVADGDGQELSGPIGVAIQRIRHDIEDLQGAIDRCREKGAKPHSDGPAPAESAPLRHGDDGQIVRRPGQAPGAQNGVMAHLIFHCPTARRVIVTGIEIDRRVFVTLPTARQMQCRFCGLDHPWEIVDRAPAAAALMSVRAEDFLGRSVQNDAYAAGSADPGIRDLYQRMAGQWFRLAVEQEVKAAALK